MTAGQILIVLAALGGTLLLSEGLLAALGLHRLHVSGLTWLVLVGAAIGGQQWAVEHHVLPSGPARGIALAVAALVTAAWFNDHGAHSRAHSRLAVRARPVAAPLTRAAATPVTAPANGPAVTAGR